MAWTALSNPRPSQHAATGHGRRFRASRIPDCRSGRIQRRDRTHRGLARHRAAGDVDAYLKMFGGTLRDRLTREADEIGRDVFARRLRGASLAQEPRGFRPEPDGDRADAARITVESTFADRIERQKFRLELDRSGWVVTEIETAREHVPQNAVRLRGDL